MFSFFLLALIPSLALAQDAALANVTTAFDEAQIVPDVLSSFTPTAVLNVVFTDPTTGLMVNVTPDATLTLEQATNQPQFFLIADDATDQAALGNTSYLIAIVDPDASSPEFLQFLGADFMFDTTAADPTTLVSETAPLVSYGIPSPATGADRYVILAYPQPSGFDAEEDTLSFGPSGFNITGFTSSAGVGAPVAGNFFIAGFSGSSAVLSSVVATGASANPTAPAAVAPSPSSGAEYLTYPALSSLLSMSFGLFLFA